MFKLIPVFLFCSMVAVSCKDNEQDKKQYYPVYAFIEQELNALDSVPLAIFKVHEEDNKIDTITIEKKQFREIVSGLLLNELKGPEALNEFEEVVLEDVSIGDVTISYTTESAKNLIKKIDIHIDRETSRIKSLYAERTEVIDGTQIIRKIFWTAGKKLMVASSYIAKGVKSKDATDRFIWNESY